MTVTKALPNHVIDNLLSEYQKPEDLIGENGLLKQLTKALVERALEAEMVNHLGHSKNQPVNNATGGSGSTMAQLESPYRSTKAHQIFCIENGY